MVPPTEIIVSNNDAPPVLRSFSTGKFDCCAQPGGCKVCVRGCLICGCTQQLYGEAMALAQIDNHAFNTTCVLCGASFLFGVFPILSPGVWIKGFTIPFIEHCFGCFSQASAGLDVYMASWMGSNRSKLRTKYGIAHEPCCVCCSVCASKQEDVISDCCGHLWCYPCLVCQEYREVKLMSERINY